MVWTKVLDDTGGGSSITGIGLHFVEMPVGFARGVVGIGCGVSPNGGSREYGMSLSESGGFGSLDEASWFERGAMAPVAGREWVDAPRGDGHWRRWVSMGGFMGMAFTGVPYRNGGPYSLPFGRDERFWVCPAEMAVVLLSNRLLGDGGTYPVEDEDGYGVGWLKRGLEAGLRTCLERGVGMADGLPTVLIRLACGGRGERYGMLAGGVLRGMRVDWGMEDGASLAQAGIDEEVLSSLLGKGVFDCSLEGLPVFLAEGGLGEAASTAEGRILSTVAEAKGGLARMARI